MPDPASPTPDGPSPAGDPADPTRVLQLFQVQITQAGSLPPEHLHALNAIDPELARKVVEESLEIQRQMVQAWVRQQEHTRELEREQAKQVHWLAAQDQKAEIDDRGRGRAFQARGQWIAAGVTAGGFILCGIALVLRLEAAAIALGCGMIAVLAAVFITGRLIRPRPPEPPSPPTDPA